MILRNKEDKVLFLETLVKFKDRFKFKLYAFCIMDNHVHLVIEAAEKANISKIMQAITLSYSQKFRRKYNYSGYVWQGRFKSNVIEGEKYIIDCIEYAHNNPVRASLVEVPEDYQWSSYHFYHSGENPIKEQIEIDIFGNDAEEETVLSEAHDKNSVPGTKK